MKKSLTAAWIVISLGMSVGAYAQNAALRVGAAKVDVTPAPADLPKNYDGILDHIYSRAIVIDNGTASAALISVDAGGVPDPIWQAVSKQLEADLGIPAKNVLLSATHSHSVPNQPPGPYIQKIVESVRLAKQRLAPARIGYGTGVSYINVNRNIIDPKTRRWWEGPNYEGPSDKTVAVIKFESLSGEPLAVYFNYAMHGVAAGQLDLVSGDAPGTTSKYIEDSFDDKIVALWSSGAAGDQNPIYFQQTYDLREIRIKDYAKRGIDISNSMPSGGQGLNKKDPTVIKLMNQQKQMILSMGQFLGEEVMHVMREMERPDSNIRVDGRFKTVSCPGRERTNEGRAGFPGEYKPAGPVDIRLGLLRLGDIMIGAVNAEVFNPIAQRLKKESPYARTMMATLTNGSARSGYIPHDAGFGMYTFEVLSSRLQPGCAESAIVNGILDLMDSKQ
ncbi:MAG TPA: neutral/alkaline non-lysosomal ceramidase N-terminal domain-containing protein [Bryobacteraceae bacterium]|nr:neutral/alkaline non-lysosomal ceramidase N-terminal domain-containing protein [Bryobacteraceae bacterium]